MIILEKVLDIYQKYYICPYCLGRMFALLGTDTTNYERGSSLLLSLTLENHRTLLTNKDKHKIALQNLQILAEYAKFSPARKVLEKEGFEYSNSKSSKTCYLCNDIFLKLQKFVNAALIKVEEYEFDSFLCGTSPSSILINQEDKFKAEFSLLESESFKNHFNREVGKLLASSLNKIPEFENPDIVFIFSLDFVEFEVQLLIRSLFISGRYKKLIRGIPQTRWPCRKCQGRGCNDCNFTGTQYDTSVEQLITPLFVEKSQATGSKFHGAGREDIDVRMLGTGRPFILELKEPKKRDLNLSFIMKEVNKIQAGKVVISNLKYSSKREVISLKSEAEHTKKVYQVLVEAEKAITKSEFERKIISLKKIIENNNIHQRTPIRVSHRRADLIREKAIYNIEGEYLSSNIFTFTIETQGGTYIKELISGDEGRTRPSFSEVFGNKLFCKELDVISIKE